jgi:hypothetical protein
MESLTPNVYSCDCYCPTHKDTMMIVTGCSGAGKTRFTNELVQGLVTQQMPQETSSYMVRTVSEIMFLLDAFFSCRGSQWSDPVRSRCTRRVNITLTPEGIVSSASMRTLFVDLSHIAPLSSSSGGGATAGNGSLVEKVPSRAFEIFHRVLIGLSEEESLSLNLLNCTHASFQQCNILLKLFSQYCIWYLIKHNFFLRCHWLLR